MSLKSKCLKITSKQSSSKFVIFVVPEMLSVFPGESIDVVEVSTSELDLFEFF